VRSRYSCARSASPLRCSRSRARRSLPRCSWWPAPARPVLPIRPGQPPWGGRCTAPGSQRPAPPYVPAGPGSARCGTRRPGWLGGLCANQQQVAQAVAVELRGGVQHRPPPLGLHQRHDTFADLLMQRSELVLPASRRAGCAASACAGAQLSLPVPSRRAVRVGRCPPALRAVGSPLPRKAARRGRSGSPDKGTSPRSFPRSARGRILSALARGGATPHNPRGNLGKLSRPQAVRAGHAGAVLCGLSCSSGGLVGAVLLSTAA